MEDWCVPHYFQYKQVTFLSFSHNLSRILNYQMLDICPVLYVSCTDYRSLLYRPRYCHRPLLPG